MRERKNKMIELKKEEEKNQDQPISINSKDSKDEEYEEEESSTHEVKKENEETKIQCPVLGCNKKTYSVYNLSMHLKKHSESNFYCSFCKNKFLDKLSFLKHLKQHSLFDGIKCKLCGDKFISRKKLYIHEKRHAEAEKEILNNDDLNSKNIDVVNIIKRIIKKYSLLPKEIEKENKEDDEDDNTINLDKTETPPKKVDDIIENPPINSDK